MSQQQAATEIFNDDEDVKALAKKILKLSGSRKLQKAIVILEYAIDDYGTEDGRITLVAHRLRSEAGAKNLGKAVLAELEKDIKKLHTARVERSFDDGDIMHYAEIQAGGNIWSNTEGDAEEAFKVLKEFIRSGWDDIEEVAQALEERAGVDYSFNEHVLAEVKEEIATALSEASKQERKNLKPKHMLKHRKQQVEESFKKSKKDLEERLTKFRSEHAEGQQAGRAR